MVRQMMSRRFFLGNMVAGVIALPARDETAAPQDGFRILEAREEKLQLLPIPAMQSAIWGFDGRVPGPLLRFKKGEEVKIRLVNRLSQPVSLNWHGVRITNPMDGVAGLTQEPVPPGGSFDYRFTPPDSGLFWYHSHALPFLREQLARGFYGAMIVDEAEPPFADCDIVALIGDWPPGATDQSGRFVSSCASSRAGAPCPIVTAGGNAAPANIMLPPSSRLRLRIIYAATAPVAAAVFSSVTPLVLAIDSQPCEAFEPAKNQLPLAPGARFDLMLDLPAAPDADASLRLVGGSGEDQVLLVLKTAGEKRSPLPPITSLPQDTVLPAEIRLESARRFNISIDARASAPGTANPAAGQERPLSFKLNGKFFEGFAPPPLFSVRRGTPVALGLSNGTDMVQALHVHGHAMRLLHDLDDGWEPYWRDTVLVAPGKTKHVAFIADNPGKWAIDGFTAAPQAAGTASWFEVS
jgi:FtsP/CotA-like multicopper oxidase with cupredoxin domain